MAFPAPDNLQEILKCHEAESYGVEVDDEAVLLDIDTVNDYLRLQSYQEREHIPNQEQCMKLLEEAKVEESVRDHCCMVAAVACQLVRLLNNAGAGLNMKLVRSAALLHDIRRNEKDHALTGAMFLRTCGYAQVDMKSTEGEFSTESEVVYLADKLVMGQRCVPLKERFSAALARHKGDENALISILRRQEQAEKIKGKVERIIGCTLEALPPVNMADLENYREA
jgi:putative nucleotidyltransferase with HDIG domain